MTEVGTEEPFACKTCEQRFSEVEYWIQHQSFCEFGNLFKHLYQRRGRFACPICNERFSEEEYWIQHKSACKFENLFKIPDQESGRFACPICNEKFYHPSDLNCHLADHKDEISFLCLICKKEGDVKSNLEKHLLDPSKEKLYTYQIDKKHLSFSTRHLADNSNMFEISIKKLSTPCNKNIYDHNPLHFPYVCETCTIKTLDGISTADPISEPSGIFCHFEDIEEY